MRKVMGFVTLGLIFVAVYLVAAYKVEVTDVNGFVETDPLGASDSFFSVYDLKNGHFVSTYSIDVRFFCPPVGVVCSDVGDKTYFGYRPSMGDHIRVREYRVYRRWDNPREVSEIISFTAVDKLPQVVHAEAVVPSFTINVIVDGVDMGTYDNLGDVVTDVIVPAIVPTPTH